MLEEYGDDIRFSEDQRAAMAFRKGIDISRYLWPDGKLSYKFEDNGNYIFVNGNGYPTCYISILL